MKCLNGMRFGRLVVIDLDRVQPRKPSGFLYHWKCLCDCGQVKVINGQSLVRGSTRSCGCLSRELTAARSRKAIRTSDDLAYGCWSSMKSRCYDKKHKHYHRYGGKGISVCERWRKSFVNFLADVGPRPSPQHSLDRYPDKKGNYEPGNVRWATSQEQQRNMLSNRLLTFGGRTMTITEWSEVLGIKMTTIRARLKRGHSVEMALTLPVGCSA